jgi:formyltetrahydrofolate deformylase
LIIAQDVENVTHLDIVESLTNRGRDIERRVLTRAIRYHFENRILLNEHKTVVFTD